MSEHQLFCNKDVTKPWSGRLFVSVDDASFALSRNQGNRRPRPAAVNYLAKIMAQGEWQDDHPQPVVFSSTGRLIDGQHRIMAIVQSKIGVWMNVVLGARDDLQKHIDTGITRALEDRVRFHENYSINKNIAAIIRTYNNVRTNYRWGQKTKLTPEQAMEFFNEKKEAIIFAAQFLSRSHRYICRTAVAMAFMEMYLIDKVAAEQFMESLCVVDGEIQQARILRDVLLNSRSQAGGMAETSTTFKKCISAMRSFLEGKEVKQIKARSEWK